MEPGKTTRRPKLKVDGGARGVGSRSTSGATVSPKGGTKPKSSSGKVDKTAVTATKSSRRATPKAAGRQKAARLNLTDRRRRLLEHMQGEAPAGAEQPTKGKAKPKSAKSRVNTPIEKMALGIAHAGLEKKAQDVEIIDVRGKVDYADFVIVMSGRSDRQVAAIARFIDEEVKRQYGVRSLSMEGVPQGVWVLIDFGDIVVHVFHEETRHYYNLESFWMDAKRVRVTEPTRAAKRSAESTR